MAQVLNGASGILSVSKIFGLSLSMGIKNTKYWYVIRIFCSILAGLLLIPYILVIPVSAATMSVDVDDHETLITTATTVCVCNYDIMRLKVAPIVEEIVVEKKSTDELINDILSLIPENHRQSYEVWLRLRYYGLSQNATAAILGNIMAECGGQTLTIHKDAGFKEKNKPVGICQWLNGRKIRLINTYGLDPTIKEQVEFIILELNESYYKSTLDYLLDSKYTLKQYTQRFLIWFEGCQNGSYTRYNNAKLALNTFSQYEDQYGSLV